MLQKMNEFLTVSLSEDVLKIAHLKSGGSEAKVQHIFSQDVQSLAESEIIKIIQTAVKKINIKTTSAVYVIPPGLTSTKIIEIPSVNPEEIKSIVNLQAGRHTPFSREEIQIGYINLGVYKANYTKVFLVIVNRNNLKSQLLIFEKAGLKVEKVLFAPEGIANFYSHTSYWDNNTPIGIIDLSKHCADFVIVNHGLPITTRHINIGHAHLSDEGAKALEKFVSELQKTVEAYQSDDIDQVPSRYVITGGGTNAEEVRNALKEKCGWEVEIVSYVDYMKASQEVLRQLGTDYNNMSFLDTVSSAAVVNTCQVNLIPEELLLQKSVLEQGKEVFKTAILFFISLVLVASALGLKIFFKNTHLTKLKQDFQKSRNEVALLEKTSTKVNLIKSYLSARMVSLDVINELYRKVPNEIYLTSINMDEEGNVNIQGVSDIASLVFNLGTTLKDSDLFKSVEIKSTTAKKDRGKDVSAFEIALRLKTANEPEKPVKAQAAPAVKTSTK